MDFRIIHHHIGARGNVPLPLDGKSPIRKDFAVYYYDADESALTDTLRHLINVGEAKLLPYCLGARRERQLPHGDHGRPGLDVLLDLSSDLFDLDAEGL